MEEEESLSDILEKLGLGEYEENFRKEQIDTEALVSHFCRFLTIILSRMLNVATSGYVGTYPESNPLILINFFN